VHHVNLRTLYEAGGRHNGEWLMNFMRERVLTDPYLRCFKDVARLHRRFERFEDV
jgi:hypothetical protein